MDGLEEFLATPFKNIDKNLLLRKYEEVFNKSLDPKCQLCYRRAYIELKNHVSVMKNNTLEKKETPKLGKYNFAPGHEGSTIIIVHKGWTIDGETGISDEQGDYITANMPDHAALIVKSE